MLLLSDLLEAFPRSAVICGSIAAALFETEKQLSVGSFFVPRPQIETWITRVHHGDANGQNQCMSVTGERRTFGLPCKKQVAPRHPFTLAAAPSRRPRLPPRIYSGKGPKFEAVNVSPYPGRPGSVGGWHFMRKGVRRGRGWT